MDDPLSNPVFALALRVYFYITIALFVFSFMLFPQSPSQMLLDMFWLGGLVPLYGYTHQVPLISPVVWQVFFVLALFVFVGQFAYAFYVVGAAIRSVLGAVLTGVGLAVVFIAPMLWANFLYAFRSPHLWSSH